jgi:hypothetical protein
MCVYMCVWVDLIVCDLGTSLIRKKRCIVAFLIYVIDLKNIYMLVKKTIVIFFISWTVNIIQLDLRHRGSIKFHWANKDFHNCWKYTHSVGPLWTSDRLVAETSTSQHTTFTRDKTSMPSVVFEPAIQTSERSQTYAIDNSATGIGHTLLYKWICFIILSDNWKRNSRTMSRTRDTTIGYGML